MVVVVGGGGGGLELVCGRPTLALVSALDLFHMHELQVCNYLETPRSPLSADLLI